VPSKETVQQAREALALGLIAANVLVAGLIIALFQVQVWFWAVR
jgi:hypothetical protein